MPRKVLETDVFNEALDRMVKLYEEGHRIMVSFSGGKDSTCLMGICRLAAELTGRLPLELVVRDEEIMPPGLYEYIERVKQDPDIVVHHLVAHQPIINCYNRRDPYFWVFDPALPPEKHFRPMPEDAIVIEDKNIEAMTIPSRFPPPKGKKLIAVVGLRAQESRGRMYGIHMTNGYMKKPNKHGVANARPIYDWQDRDVWKAIQDNGWDYSKAYDTLYRMGVATRSLRMAPPTMNIHGIKILRAAAKAWPQWFDKVCERCPGVRSGVHYGMHAITPIRRSGETWDECYRRTCIQDAPKWTADRARVAMDKMLSMHSRHSTAPFPEITPCHVCYGNIGAWKPLAEAMFLGDPFSTKQNVLPLVEPEFFRAGSGTWGGSPSF